MRRFNNLYEKVISIENLELADSIARKGKTKRPGVLNHDKNSNLNILKLHKALKNKTFKLRIIIPLRFLKLRNV